MTPASPLTLYSAIHAAKAGDTIALAPGSYGNPSWKSLATDPKYGIPAFDPPLTITSADPANPAVFAGITLTNVTGLAFSHIEVTPDPRLGFCLSTSGGKGLSFDRMNIHGPAVGSGQAAMFRTSADVSVTNSEIHDLGTGLNHLNCNGLTISGNTLHDIQVDAIRGGGSSNVTICGNTIHSLHSLPGDHADAIQFWTNGGATGPASNITVTDNIITRGTGLPMQGVFMGNEASLQYHNVTIKGNALDGTMYNGIAVQLADNVTIEDNLVHGYSDMTSWVYLTKVTNATLKGNSANLIKADATNVGLVNTGNTTIPQGPVGDVSALTTWQARNAPPVDPRDAQIADLIAKLSAAADADVIDHAAVADLQAKLQAANAALAADEAKIAAAKGALGE